MSKRNIIDDGYAVWLIEQNKGVSFLDIHINEWFSYKEQTYLDMGLRVYNANNVNGICLFFPFCIAKNEIIDLFNLISVPEIASDIFNTICAVSPLKVSHVSNLEYNGRKENAIEFFNILSTETVIDKQRTGTIICFDLSSIHDILTSAEVYIRFRVPHKSVNDLFKSDVKLSYIISCLSTPESEFEYIFVNRFNDIRNLPEIIKRYLSDNNHKIKKIITSISIPKDMDIDDSKCYKIRKLENISLSKYIPCSFRSEDTLAFQWLSENKEHYYSYFKMNKKSYKFIRVIVYVLIVIMLSCFGSALWQLFANLFGGK